MANCLQQETYGANEADFSQLRFNNCRYIQAKRSLITPDGNEIRLRAKTCLVFEQLASQPNKVLSRDYLINMVWGEVVASDDSLNQSIREIRVALGDANRQILETLPRQGYLLHAIRTPDPTDSVVAASFSKNLHGVSLIPLVAIASLLLISGIFLLQTKYLAPDNQLSMVDEVNPTIQTNNLQGSELENLNVIVQVVGGSSNEIRDRLTKSVVTALSRYSNIVPTQPRDLPSDYKLELSLLDDDGSSINLQLQHLKSNKLVLAENFEQSVSTNLSAMANRIAALVGSPAGGAIGHHLLSISRGKPVKNLSRPECLAHGYGCTSCSGEFDSVNSRAVQCLANLLENNAEDADAWALQSTVYSRQYLWGSSLQEPMRSDKSKRTHLQQKAIEAATRAEAQADGTNPSVYWGMVQAYLASCDSEKMQVAIDRGLKLNPGDPSMLAVYGNFLSYSGNWDKGKALVEQALETEPIFFKKWWYMSLAKWHYRKGEYQLAYDLFIKSFNERNWLSHLQLAYTLPHLGRVQEAKKALQDFMRVAPSMTREHVYEFYRSYCFDDDYLNRVKVAFDLIEMPSRGSGDDFTDIKPVRASVEKIGNRMVEHVDVGDGIPLVFVHGSISDYRTWGYMLLPVSERYRFISYTLRYFGTLDWPPGAHRFDENVDAQDLIDFIEHKELGPVFLVGWSRSGAIISAVARLRPDLVKGIIQYEPVLGELLDRDEDLASLSNSPDFSGVKKLIEQQDLNAGAMQFFERALERNAGEFKTEPTMLQKVVLDNARTLPLNFGEHAPDQPIVDCKYINKLEVPGLVLFGERTNTAWQDMSRRYSDCLKKGKLVVVKNANHDGPLSQPQSIADYISDFIEDTQ